VKGERKRQFYVEGIEFVGRRMHYAAPDRERVIQALRPSWLLWLRMKWVLARRKSAVPGQGRAKRPATQILLRNWAASAVEGVGLRSAG